MRTFIKVLGWALLGAILAWAMTFAACLLYDEAVPKPAGNDSRPWMQFALLMFSPWLGVISGIIYGIDRARSSPKATDSSDGPSTH